MRRYPEHALIIGGALALSPLITWWWVEASVGLLGVCVVSYAQIACGYMTAVWLRELPREAIEEGEERSEPGVEPLQFQKTKLRAPDHMIPRPRR